MKNQKWVAAGFIVYLCIASVWCAKFLMRGSPDHAFGVRLAGRAKGVPEAELKITEFFDYQCQACRTAHQTLNEYFQKYPGQIYLELRFNPLPNHRHGFLSALYAYCADEQKRFWGWHNLLFETQLDWSFLQNTDEKFHEYARSIGLNLTKLDACLKNPKAEKFVKEEKANNESLGIRVTPSFLINKKLVVGSKPLVEELNRYFSNSTKGESYDTDARYA